MDLLENPFHILAASPRDNRRRIMELADERSLLLDSSKCMESRSELTNPRKRLSAEVAWLPGIGPQLAGEVLLLLESSPTDLLAVDKLSSIVRANLLAAGLARLTDYNADDVAKWILEIAWAFENINPEELSMIINKERVVSGFPEVTDLSAIEAEIQERRRYYRKVIKSALNNLSAKELVEAVTSAVKSATDNGENHGPILIADLVDSYEVEAQGFFEKEESNIKAMVERLRAAVDAEQPDSVLAPMANQLIQVAKNWDNVAQPIQISTKSRGLNHNASRRIAELVRNLAIHMFNEHGKLDFSRQLTNMLQEVFAEVGEVAERTAEDADALENIAEQQARKQHKKRAASSTRVSTGKNRDPDSRQLPSKDNASGSKSVKPVSGGLFSGITKLLLAIPWQLYLVGGVIGYFYYQNTMKDRVIDSFNGKMDYYLTRGADLNSIPRLAPGVLPVDLKTRAVDRMYFQLKDGYKPKSADDVSSVVAFKCSDEVVGSYSDGASGYQKSCDIYVIEVSNHTWSYVGNFTGTGPPNSKKGSGSRTGSHPVNDYLRKAGVM